MKQNQLLTIIAAMTMTVTVGCSKMQSSGAGNALTNASTSGASSTTAAELVSQTNQDIAAFNQQNTALMNQVSSLNTQLNSIGLPLLENGGLNTGVVIASQTAAGSPARMRSLQSFISNMLNGAYNGISKVYTQINNLQLKIENRIAQLNLNDPTQLAAATALEGALTYLAQARAKLNTLVVQLVTKVQGLTASLDAKLASLNQSNPLTWIAEVYWAQIKPLFVNFETELTALTQ